MGRVPIVSYDARVRYFIWTIAALLSSGCSFDPEAAGSLFSSDDTGVIGVPDLTIPRDAAGANDAAQASDMSLPRDDGPESADLDPADQSPDAMSTPDAAPDMPTMQACDGQLVDTTTSTTHCGSCGNACDPTFGRCVGGSCECFDSFVACGPENTCTNAAFDPRHCGQCGIECGPNEVCFEDRCVCFPGFERCNGECVDVESDPRHCGGCGVNCNGDICKEAQCESRNSCGLRWFECPVPNAGTACVQNEANPAHCGASLFDECGTACGAAEICFRQGAFDPFECREFRPAIGCTSCPCGNCQGEFCVESDEVEDVVFCVKNQ